MVTRKTEADLAKLRISGKILAAVLKELKKEVREGVALDELETKARTHIKEFGAEPAFLGYRAHPSSSPYPAALCTSVNDEVVHALPRPYRVKNGDVLKLDLGVAYEGYITDGAITLGIGRIGKEAEALVKTTKLALEKAIKLCSPGTRIGDIGWIIERTARTRSLNIVKGLTGHGVGFALHEEPTVYNYGERGSGVMLEPGMVIAIEPMITTGSGEMAETAEGAFVTKDGALGAHFEKTVAITSRGHEVLTPIE